MRPGQRVALTPANEIGLEAPVAGTGHDPADAPTPYWGLAPETSEKKNRRTSGGLLADDPNLDILNGMCILVPGGETVVRMPFAWLGPVPFPDTCRKRLVCGSVPYQ
jgi:hypothetical protein